VLSGGNLRAFRKDILPQSARQMSDTVHMEDVASSEKLCKFLPHHTRQWYLSDISLQNVDRTQTKDRQKR